MSIDLFLNEWTRINRNMVRAEKKKGENFSLDDTKEYIGHIYEDDGRYRTYYLTAGVDNIARFICSNQQDKFITSGDDRAVMTTIGKYIDLCCISEDERMELIRLINQYQHENTEFMHNNG